MSDIMLKDPQYKEPIAFDGIKTQWRILKVCETFFVSMIICHISCWQSIERIFT